MKIYISGPMTGRPNLNFPLFHDVALALRMGGWDVVNPTELCPDPNAEWAACMRKDIVALMECDSMVLLPEWHQSRGAKIEYGLAKALGMQVFELREVLAMLPPSTPQGPAIQALVFA